MTARDERGGIDGRVLTVIAPKTVMPNPHAPPRTTARMLAFDHGEEPLPAWSWPRPRRTGWERDWQR
jgi:hypothetical protein